MLKSKRITTVLGPYTTYTCYSPSDFNSSEQWALVKTDASKAWDITKGSTNIKISINDFWEHWTNDSQNEYHQVHGGGCTGTESLNYLHNELRNNKVVYNNANYSGGHGTEVAGAAACLTDNGTGIAGIGFNSSLMFFWSSYTGLYQADQNQADIINLSVGNSQCYDSSEETLIGNILNVGRIVVAAAGNGPDKEPNIPSPSYPAAYNYSSGRQVIAVSATGLNNGDEQFADPPIATSSFNYSPTNNPDSDPTNSFIDFAGPGVLVKLLLNTTTDQYRLGSGTSESSPFVAGVLALVKSIYPSLTPQTAYTILKNSVDKVDQSRHPDSYTDANGYGWNQYTGWGRVNAYKALKYTIERYGGTFNQNVILPAGDTWTLQPGVTLSFASGCALIVNGTLNAVGTSSSGITFTKSGASNWSGIQFNPGSSGNLNYCSIQNAGNGIYCYNSSPTIKHSTIDNNSSTGLYLNYYSSPVLVGNNFRFNGSYGIRCESYSSPNLTDNGYPGSNVIRNNGTGILTSYYSNPNLNGYMTYGNSVFDNTGYEVSANANCTVSAQRVYWGSGATYYTSGSTIDYSNPLGSNPNPGRSVVADNSSNSISGVISLKVVADDLSPALDKQKDKKYDEAIPLFLEVFKNNKDALLGKYALSKIEECYTQAGKKDYLDYSKKEIKPLLRDGSESYVVALELETHQMVNNGYYKEAIGNLQTILKKYNINCEIDKNTLFTLGAVYSLYYGDKGNANKYFDELKRKYSGDQILENIDRILSVGLLSPEYLSTAPVASPEIAENGVKESIAEELVSNYPNPFNPETNISFTLKTGGKVSLKVYDVLGKEVSNLADGHYDAGKHTATFDGGNLASGIYFYRLTTPTATITKKMVLTK